MSDDPRGHDDGDIFVGKLSAREEALDLQFVQFDNDSMSLQGFSDDELINAHVRAIQRLRWGKSNSAATASGEKS